MQGMDEEATTDAVGQMVEQWRHERPDLDASPMLLVGRVFHLANRWDRRNVR